LAVGLLAAIAINHAAVVRLFTLDGPRHFRILAPLAFGLGVLSLLACTILRLERWALPLLIGLATPALAAAAFYPSLHKPLAPRPRLGRRAQTRAARLSCSWEWTAPTGS
ncbi:MAG TPA: hypothetical protein VIZ31_02235, partial [Vicinamibacteria bacterium]